MDTSQSDNQASPEQPVEEHETHTTALVFLAIVAIVISFVALRGGDGISPFAGDDSDTSSTEQQSGTNGSLIQQETVETTQADGVAGLPDGVYIEESRIQSNQVTADGQQVVRFSSDLSTTDLFDSYEAWMEDAGYTINQRVQDDRGAKLAASGSAGEQLTVSITSPDDAASASSVMIDYVAVQ